MVLGFRGRFEEFYVCLNRELGIRYCVLYLTRFFSTSVLVIYCLFPAHCLANEEKRGLYINLEFSGFSRGRSGGFVVRFFSRSFLFGSSCA